VLVCGFGLPVGYPQALAYHRLKLIDLPMFECIRFFPEACNTLEKFLEQGKAVLVHWYALGRIRWLSVVWKQSAECFAACALVRVARAAARRSSLRT
jgi:hypothetical protein